MIATNKIGATQADVAVLNVLTSKNGKPFTLDGFRSS